MSPDVLRQIHQTTYEIPGHINQGGALFCGGAKLLCESFGVGGRESKCLSSRMFGTAA